MATKITFLLQYYRVLAVRKMQTIVMLALVSVTLWSLAQLLVVIFTCSPIDRFWDQELPGTCIPNLPFWYINAGGNIVTDVIIFVLPLPVMTSLNLRATQKLMLIGIFSLGFFVSAPTYLPLPFLARLILCLCFQPKDMRDIYHTHPISASQRRYYLG